MLSKTHDYLYMVFGKGKTIKAFGIIKPCEAHQFIWWKKTTCNGKKNV